jgi:large subunit ribosomal protein L25
MVNLSIKALVREKVGTGAARATRREKMVPGVIYNKSGNSVHVAISEKDAINVCHKFDVKTKAVHLDIGSKDLKVLPKKVSVHPVTDAIEHIEFLSVEGSLQVVVDIPVKVVGKENSIEIKRGGVINMAKRSLKCTVNSDNIPAMISIDISQVKMGIPVSLRDIVVPSGVVAIHENLDQTILKITGKRSAATLDAGDEKEASAATTAPAASADKKEDAKK